MSLSTALFAATGAMRVFERSLEVASTNVSNVNTPGYVKHRQEIISFRDGISAGKVASSRNLYNESSVWQRQSGLAKSQQQIDTLGQVEQALPIGEGLGIADSLNNFFTAFTQLSAAPNSITGRQVVLNKAQTLANDFNTTANRLARSSQFSEQEVSAVVSKINGVLADVASFNKGVRSDSRVNEDGGVESRLFQSLESLSEYADFQALPQDDGSVSVYLGGQSLGAIGDKNFAIKSVVVNNQVQIQDFDGKDISANFQSGKLAALLDFRNRQFPGYAADLDTLAASVADSVNTTLSAGLDLAGNPPAVNLFVYTPTQGAAFTLGLGGLLPEELAAASSGAPGGNGAALAVADLAKQPQVNGYTFTQFYGTIAANVGADIASAKAEQTSGTQLLSQARTIRGDASAVSLDEEAAYVLQIQRGYEAVSKLMTVIRSLTDTVMGLIR